MPRVRRQVSKALRRERNQCECPSWVPPPRYPTQATQHLAPNTGQLLESCEAEAEPSQPWVNRIKSS